MPPRAPAVIAVDLGGTKTAAGLVAADGSVSHYSEVATPSAAGSRAVLDAVIGLVHGVRASSAGAPVAGVGVGSAGVIDPVSGDVLSATDTIAGWAGTPLRRELESALGLPVAVLNDVHAHALGEATLGAGRGRSTVLLVAVGTGVGGALVIDGAVQRGRHGAAGHYGHLSSPFATGLACTCGRSGHVEAIAAGPSIHRAYLRNGGDAAVLDTKALFARVDVDPIAASSVRASARASGSLIGDLVNATDPDVVVVAGGLASAGGGWWSDLQEAAMAEMLPLLTGCPVVRAALGRNSALVGAAVQFSLTKGDPR